MLLYFAIFRFSTPSLRLPIFILFFAAHYFAIFIAGHFADIAFRR
jgi:hypothetical protein